MRRARIKLGFDYSDTPERKVVSLEADGIACVPAIGFDNFQRAWKVPEVHYHPECLEMSLCLRGSLGFEFRGIPSVSASTGFCSGYRPADFRSCGFRPGRNGGLCRS